MFKKQKYILFYLVYFIFLGLTYFFWRYIFEQNQQTVKQNFKADYQAVLRYQIKEQIESHVNALNGLRSFFDTNVEVSQKNWHEYISKTRVLEKGASISSLAFVKQAENDKYSLTLIEPAASRDFNLGADISSQPAITAVINNVRANSSPIATSLIDDGQGKRVIIILPVFFSAKSASTTVAAVNVSPQKKADGFILATLNTSDFFKNIFKDNYQEMNVEVFDGSYKNGLTSAMLLYDTKPEQTALFAQTNSVNVLSAISMAGRSWSIYQSVPLDYGLTKIEKILPYIILFLGLILSWLLATIFYFLLTANIRAEKMAMVMTAKLRESEQRLSAVLYSITDGVFVVDMESRVTLINQAALAMRGCGTMEKVLGKKGDAVFNLVSEDDQQETGSRQSIEKIVDGKTANTISHLLLVRQDGTKIAVAKNAAQLKDKNGQLAGYVVVLRNMAKEREIEKMKDEFISLASHQLRTPLTAIKLFVEMLAREEVGKLNIKQKEYMENVSQSTVRMVRLVGDLLNVSRIETGRLKVEPEVGQLEDFVKKLVDEFKPLAKAHNCEVIFASLKKLSPVAFDFTLLRQVVYNLISNAVRYSPPRQSKIWVKVTTDKEKNYIISVKDLGIGIAKEVQTRVFQKFFRSDSAVKAVADGSGLGLYMAKMIMEVSGGKVWFKSGGIGRGSTFYIKIPAGGMKKRGGEKGLTPIM